MLFTESFITDAGKLIFARAAAQEGRIVWTRAATSSLNTNDYTTAQMNALTESTFGTKTSSGVVTNAIVTDPQDAVSIFSEVTNEEYYGDALTFGAWAKIEGDESDVLVVAARCGAGVTPTTINPASEGVVKAFVDFTVNISAEQAQAVQPYEGWYASQNALQAEREAREALAARVVTTHKKDSAVQGDDQTILGSKTFKATIISDSGSMAAIEKTSGDFNAYIGGYLVNRYEIGGATYDYYTTEYCVNDGKDYHRLISDSEGSQEGVNRSFGLVSEYYDGTAGHKVAKIQNYIDDNAGTVEGRVHIEASNQSGNAQSTADMTKNSISLSARDVNISSTDFVLNSSGYAEIISDEVGIGAEDRLVLGSIASASDNMQLVLSHESGSNGTVYTLAPEKTISSSELHFGSPSSKIDHVYAETFHGDLDGTARIARFAQYDPDGESIQNYLRYVLTLETNTSISFFNGHDNIPTSMIWINALVALSLLGKRVESDSIFSSVGAVGLFSFGLSGQSEYNPGDLLPGSALFAACMLYDNNTHSVTIDESLTAQSGTWRLLSRAVGTVGYMSLVLAVKVSESNPA